MNLDWASINDFKCDWQFKHRRSFIQCGTLDNSVPGNPGVYMEIRNSSSATEFVENGTADFIWEESERSNQQIEERLGG